jgi:protein-tyrosine phosphatase
MPIITGMENNKIYYSQNSDRVMKHFRFIDSHTHILPGMDDGAQNVEESEQMILSLSKQGIEEIFLTPHYYSHKESVDNFLQRREESFQALKSTLYRSGMKYRLGAEVYAIPAIFNYANLDNLCIEGTDLLLLEMSSPKSEPEHELNLIAEIYSRYPIKIVLAHIDRYPFMLKQKVFKQFTQLDVYMQLNLNFLDAGFLTKQRCLKYLKQGHIQFLGTDCHRITGKRSPEVEKYRSQLKAKLTEEELNDIY